MTTEIKTETALVKSFPCDLALREKALALIATGVTQSQIARGSNIASAIVSQWLNPSGNVYPGDIAKYERRISAWLENRDLEFLAGIATVQSFVGEQIESVGETLRRQRIMGKAIGGAGIGKTRGCTFLAGKKANALMFYVTKETGSREAVRAWLFKKFGVRGGKTYGYSNLDKYQELIKRLREADVNFVFDQAHRLSLGALHFLCELWNETRKGILLVGTEKLFDLVERDEQIASRTRFTHILQTTPETTRELVKHQIKSLLPELNGELPALLNLCAKLAAEKSFRDVEMQLINMADLRDKDRNKGRSWTELFERSSQFTQSQIEN